MEQPTRLSDAQRRRMTGLMGALDTDPNAPGGTWYDAASLLFPYGAAARGVMAAPRAVASGLAGLGLLGGSGSLNDAEAQAKRGGAPKATPEDEALAAKLPDYMRPEFLDLRARSRAGTLARVDRNSLDRMNKVIADSAAGADEATRREALLRTQAETEAATRAATEQQGIRAGELAKAEEARMRAMADAPKTFAERFPDWNSMQGFMPFMIGAATTLPIAGRAAYGANRAVSQWRNAVDDGLKATNPVDLARANNTARAYAEKFPEGGIGATLKPYAAPAAIGAIEGAAVSNAPEAYNMFLPPENPERKAMMEYIKQLSPDHPARAQAERVLAQLPEGVPARDAAFKHFTGGGVVPRMLTGAAEGAGGAAMATTLAKPFAPSSYGYPRAGTQALADRVAGTGLDDATRAIQAETSAIGTVLPRPPPQAQLPPREPQGLLGPPQPARPPASAPAVEPLPMPTSRLQAELMVNAGLLPRAVLDRFPR